MSILRRRRQRYHHRIGETAPEHSFILFANEGEEIAITAGEDSDLLLVLERRADSTTESLAYGPYVMKYYIMPRS